MALCRCLAAAALPALAVCQLGCDLTQPTLRKNAQATAIGNGGRLVEVKRCTLTVALLARPADDHALNESLWRVADEQVVAPALRQALHANGLRIGRITGELPREVAALLRERSSSQSGVSTIANPSGQSTLIDPTQSPATRNVNLLLSQTDGKVRGKPYEAAKGYVRLTPSYDDNGGVALRIVPEVRHGPVQRSYGMAASGGVTVPHEFHMTEAQQEETFRDLAANVSLTPGQVVALGALPEREGTLGDLIFRKAEDNSDRMVQCVALIWASRSTTDSDQRQHPRPEFPIALQPSAENATPRAR
jgi:hypothetical protein